MSKSYSSFVPSTRISKANTPLNEALPGREKEMVVNSSGGMTFDIGPWKQLDRFLILGAEAPTYYASRQKLVKDNAKAVQACIKEDAVRVVNRIVEISDGGRAPKNDPALFALALVATYGDSAARKAVEDALPKVARIGTHLFHFTDYVNDLRGWGGSAGRSMKKAISGWFNNRKPENLANQAIKYRQRDGWAMRDVLRVAHPKPVSPLHNDIFRYIVKGWDSVGETPHPEKALQSIWAAERAKSLTSGKDVAKLVREYGLPWEAIDTKWLNDHDVWDALFEHVKPEALMRNLGRLTSNGFLAPMSSHVRTAVAKLTDQESLISNRLHPLKLLVALKTYQNGHGEKGSLSWKPIPQLTTALEEAYYKAFRAVEPAGKNTLLALDISGSMEMGTIAGMPLTPREAAAAMAMFTARCEPNYYFVGFSNDLMELKITDKMSLPDVVRYTSGLPFGSTNVSAPFHWASDRKLKVDTFVVITDNEVNSGYYGRSAHPTEALNQYRQKMGVDAKLVVVGMTATGFSVADPKDPGQLDCVGFDTSTPQLINDFSAGRI